MNYYNSHGRKRADLRMAVDVAGQMMEDSKSGQLEHEGSFLHAGAATYYVMTLQETYINQKENGATPAELETAKANIVKYAREGSASIRQMRGKVIEKRMSEVTGTYFTAYQEGGGSRQVVHGVRNTAFKPKNCNGRYNEYEYPRNDPYLRFPHEVFRDGFTQFWMKTEVDWLFAICLGPNYAKDFTNSRREIYVRNLHASIARDTHVLEETAASLDAIAANPVPGVL